MTLLQKIKKTSTQNEKRNKPKAVQTYSKRTFAFVTETWTLKTRDWNKIQNVKIKILRSTKGQSRLTK